MSISSQKKMLMTSTFPLDKVVYLNSGSFAIGASSTVTKTYEHNLDFTPLCSGNWSTDPTFGLQYEYSTGIFPSTNPGFVFDTIFNVYADERYVYITGDNLGGPLTIYFRVYGFEPSNSTALVEPVGSQGDSFVIDSRLNYPKLYLNNYVDLPAGGSTDGYLYIDHNIGTIPQVMAWVTYYTFNGVTGVQAVHPLGTSNSASQGITLVAGNTRIAFGIPAFVDPHRAYYRLYLDE